MTIRHSWPGEDQAFDAPFDAHLAPPRDARRPVEGDEDEAFRALLDDPEACWQWEPS